MVRQRIRVRFSKKGDLRLISHRDLSRAFERMLRRAGLQLAMSQGFHPHPQMTFPAALALGIEGLAEVVDIGLDQEVKREEIHRQMAAAAPPGLEIHSVDLLDPGHAKARAIRVQYEISLPSSLHAQTSDAIEQLQARPTLAVKRKGKSVAIDLASAIDTISLADDGVLRIRMHVSAEAQPRPRELLEALGLADLEAQGHWIRRTAVELG
jgi:radical SAM-linked protein